MARVYTASFKAIAVTAAQDFFEITAPTADSVRILGWALSQSSDVGDAAEEGLSITTNRGVGATTSGSGGASVTPQPIDDGDSAVGSGCAVERNNTTVLAAGSGSLEELECYNWNIRVPFVMWYPPEARPKIIGAARWTLELETVPADSLTISGTVWFAEGA